MQTSGSSAVVVSGAGGLGEATVRRLHAGGAKVAAADLADEKGKVPEAYWGPRNPHPKRMGRSPEYAALVQHICENSYPDGEAIRLDGALRFPPR